MCATSTTNSKKISLKKFKCQKGNICCHSKLAFISGTATNSLMSEIVKQLSSDNIHSSSNQ